MKNDKIQGGDDCIEGTRIRYTDIDYLYNELKATPKEISNVYYPHLTELQVTNCLNRKVI